MWWTKIWAIEQAFLAGILHAMRGGPEIMARVSGFNGKAAVDPTTMVDGIAVIDIKGVLTKEGDPFLRYFGMQGATLPEMETAVIKAARDPDVRGILLRIDSPGGSVAGTGDLGDAIFKARQQKQVFAAIVDTCCSGGFWAGSQADKIYANPTATVGSIGAYAVVPDFSEMFRDAGVKINVIKAGKFKGTGVQGTEVTDEQKAEIQRSVDGFNELFVQAIARSRPLSLERVRELNDGRNHLAQEAQALGLIDGIKSVSEVLSEMLSGGTLSKKGNPGAFAAGAIERSPVVKDSVKRYLVALGLKVDATLAEAQAFLAKLEGAQATYAAELQAMADPSPSGGGQAGGVPNPLAGAADVGKAIAHERARVKAIKDTCVRLGISDAVAQTHIDQGTTVDGFKEVALAHAETVMKPAGANDVQVGLDRNRDTIIGALEIAIGDRMGLATPKAETDRAKLHVARAADLRYMPLYAMAGEYLVSRGGRVAGLPRDTIVRAAFNPLFAAQQGIMAVSGMHGTSDFPILMANVQGKRLLASYNETVVTWQEWCAEDSRPDFKDFKEVQTGGLATPEEVAEFGEYTAGTLGESGETGRLMKHGKKLQFSWEAIVNDDLRVLSRSLVKAGEACKRLEDLQAYGVLTDNPEMSDEKTLFHTDHANIGSTSATLTAAQIRSGLSKMEKQVDVTDLDVDITPEFLLVPKSEKLDAEEILQSQYKPGASNNEPNVLRGVLKSVGSSRLKNAAARFIVAGKNSPAVKLYFLDGHRSPLIQQTQSTNPDIWDLVYRHVVFAMAVDYRPAVKLPTA